MICRLEGQLLGVEEGTAELQCGDRCLELLVPACDEQRLATMLGRSVEFHTLEYLEGQGQGSSYIPRLIGFGSRLDREFFELFTTVKGLGNRKALRALQLPFASVAEAIAAKDLDRLISLPEIGRRTAQTILAELHGKVDRFVELKPGRPEEAALDEQTARLIADATSVLVQLGEPKAPARRLVERAARSGETMGSAEDLVAAAFRLKE